MKAWALLCLLVALVLGIAQAAKFVQGHERHDFPTAEAFDLIRDSLRTGDLILYNELSIATMEKESLSHLEGASTGDAYIDSVIGSNFTHVGLVVRLPDVKQILLLEPVIYHHQHVADNWDESVSNSYGIDLPVHWGGAVRLLDLRSHMIARAHNQSAAVRRLNVEDIQHVYSDIDAWEEEHRPLLTEFWKNTEHLPVGVTLEAHGQMPYLEGEFSARVIASALQALKVVPQSPSARSYSLADYSVAIGAAKSLPYGFPELVSFHDPNVSENEKIMQEMREYFEKESEAEEKRTQAGADQSQSGLLETRSRAKKRSTRVEPPSASLSPSTPSSPSASASNSKIAPDGYDMTNMTALEREQYRYYLTIREENKRLMAARDALLDRYNIKMPSGENRYNCNPTLCDGRVHTGILEIEFDGFEDKKNRHMYPVFAQLPRNLDNRINGDYGDQSGRFPGTPGGVGRNETFCMCIFKPAPKLPRLSAIKKDEFWGYPKDLKFPYDDTVDPEFRAFERTGTLISEPTLRVTAIDPNTFLQKMFPMFEKMVAKMSNSYFVGVHMFNLTELTTVPEGKKSRITPMQTYPIFHVDVSHSLAVLGGIFRLGKDKSDLTNVSSGASIKVAFNYTVIDPRQLCLDVPGSPCLRSEDITHKYWNNWMSTIRSGDVLLFRTTGSKEKSMMKLFNVKISHAAVVYLSPHYSIPLVFQATAVGVGLNSLRHYIFNGDYGAVMVRPLSWNSNNVQWMSDRAIQKIVQADDLKSLYLSKRQAINPIMLLHFGDIVEKYSGRSYNLKRLWEIIKAGRASLPPMLRVLVSKNKKDNTQDLFCSQLVALVFQQLRALPAAEEVLFSEDTKLKDVAIGQTTNFYSPTDFLPRCWGRSYYSHDACGGYVEEAMFAFRDPVYDLSLTDRENLRFLPTEDGRHWFRLNCPIFLLGLPESSDCVFEETAFWTCVHLKDLDGRWF